MLKFVNFLWWLSSALRGAALALKNTVPAWKRMIDANKRDKYFDELEKLSADSKPLENNKNNESK